MSEISSLEQTYILKRIDDETINIQVRVNEMLISIVGQFNQNLNDLEALTNTKIFFRGNLLQQRVKKKIQ